MFSYLFPGNRKKVDTYASIDQGSRLPIESYKWSVTLKPVGQMMLGKMMKFPTGTVAVMSPDQIAPREGIGWVLL
jgi:hypothetical protein